MIYNLINHKLVAELINVTSLEIGPSYIQLIDSSNDWFMERFILVEILSYKLMTENEIGYNIMKTIR